MSGSLRICRMVTHLKTEQDCGCPDAVGKMRRVQSETVQDCGCPDAAGKMHRVQSETVQDCGCPDAVGKMRRAQSRRNSIISRMHRLLFAIGICVIIMEETRNETCNRFNRPDRRRD